MSAVVRNQVDVLVAGAAAESVEPPHRCMVAGNAEPVTVRTRILGHPLKRRREMSLTVDPATAVRFAQASRWQATWNRVVLPAWTVVAVAMVVDAQFAVLGGVIDRVSSPLALLFIVSAFVIRLAFRRQTSPLHPRWQGRTVLVRGVDRAAAEEWAGANPPEALRIRG